MLMHGIIMDEELTSLSLPSVGGFIIAPLVIAVELEAEVDEDDVFSLAASGPKRKIISPCLTPVV